MANVLSQEEIDALLGGLSGGQIETSEQVAQPSASEGSAVAYDFADQDRLLRGRLPTLETIHDRFARLLRLNLSTTLRRTVDIQICSQTICNFGDFSRSLERPSSLHMLKMDPLRGSALLVLPARLILNLVDLMFGGDGKPFNITEDRDFTMIESRVIYKVSRDIIHCYRESWSSIYPLSLQQTGTETNVQFINIAQPNDPVNVVDCDVMIDGTRSALSFCIPYASIEPIKDILKGSFLNDDMEKDAQMTQRLRASLVESTVQVRAILGSAMITGRQLLDLKAGDIIQLNEDYEHPVEILVEGLTKYWGVIGSHKSARAIQITALEEAKRERS